MGWGTYILMKLPCESNFICVTISFMIFGRRPLMMLTNTVTVSSGITPTVALTYLGETDRDRDREGGRETERGKGMAAI